MIRTACIAAIAALGLVACGPKPEPAASSKDAATAAAEALQKQNLEAVAALGAAGGGTSNPQMKTISTSLTKVADAIVTIKDEASAKTVGQQLQPVFAEMEKASKEFEALPEGEQQAAAMAAAPQLAAAGMKIGMYMATLSPELQAIVERELDKMPKTP